MGDHIEYQMINNATVVFSTVMDAREVCITITGAHKSIALAKCIEEGVNHMWTVSAIQMHPKGLVVCDEDATLELHVKVRFFDTVTLHQCPHSYSYPKLFYPDCQVLQIYRTCASLFDRCRELVTSRWCEAASCSWSW